MQFMGSPVGLIWVLLFGFLIAFLFLVFLSFGGLLLGGFFVKFGFDVSVVEEVDEFFPFLVLLEFASEDFDFSGEEPIDHGDGEGGSVGDGDGHVDVLQWGVGVAESDAGDIHVGSLDDGLLVADGVGDDQESGLLENLGVLIGQSSWGPSGRRGGHGASELGEFEHGSLTEDSGRHHDHIRWVVDGSNDSSSQLDLLPSLLQVENVKPSLVLMTDVPLHVEVQVLGSHVAP